MAFKTQLKGDQVILAIIPAEQYQDELLKIIKFIEKNNRMVLYISSNKPRQALMDVFKRNGVNPKKFSVIEFFAPHPITELGFRISAAYQNQKFDGILLDSLQSLVVHTTHTNEVLRFIHALTVRARISGCRVILPVPYGTLSSDILNDLTMFMDSVHDVEGLRKRAVLDEVVHLSMKKSQFKNKRR